jgi:hypothetical protein
MGRGQIATFVAIIASERVSFVSTQGEQVVYGGTVTGAVTTVGEF